METCLPPRRLVVEPTSKVKEQVVASRTTTPQKVLKRIEQGPAADKDTSVQTTTNRTRHQKLVCADDSGFTEIGVRLAVSCSEREQSGPLANFLYDFLASGTWIRHCQGTSANERWCVEHTPRVRRGALAQTPPSFDH